jgi:hypothetical protein
MVEVKRPLKKDGLFIVSTPNKPSYTDLSRYQKEFLGQYFPHVGLVGQKIYPVSYIWIPGTVEGQMGSTI